MNGQAMEEGNNEKKAQVTNSGGVDLTSRQKSFVPRDKKSSPPTGQLQTKPGSHPQARRGASGPRTAQGKQRSKSNAVKHGIFAIVVVPNGESRLQYESLLRDFFEDLRPHGRVEELIVEKLVMLSWRLKRLIEAETAEIQNATELVDWDEENRQLEILKTLDPTSLSPFDEIPLIDQMENPKILERCLELLVDLREGLETRGFDKESDSQTLARIYGVCRQYRTLGDIYSTWYETSLAPEEERQREGYSSPADCKEAILEEIDHEIERLRNYQKRQRAVISQRTAWARIRLRIPPSPVLDRLLRYEASLERSFDRTLNQLERLQRMRLGEPVPPPLQVNVVSNDMPVP